MEITRRVKDAKSFIIEVANLIGRYLRDICDYPRNAQLIVQPLLLETVIDDPTNSRDCENYDIRQFVKTNRQGNFVPNMKTIKNLASRYF
ncbi:MAG: hypothetical protein PUF37_05620 [Prevotellaceae bacterium]|nr:hypothetical protein [Prevotellaceae bacterium]